ncbi:MAG TPA: tRNA (adenosine(37)-N6)-dimethylallyltransferase MiaA [Dehalococcoidia bacterium]|nr:tRNA (adenosine(37)-N6)-dimethylallyltransferase MiaA [Dehalococcoidia bacterium]
MSRAAPEPLIAVVGPTATGKSELAVVLAQVLGGEVIGADSRQVYQGMAIGTAQPGLELQAAVPHHLVGFLPPDAPFGLAIYLDSAREAIAGIWARGRVPILAGGTGQYLAALIEGWNVPRVPPHAAFRAALAAQAERDGREALHQRLATLDPDAAAGIHPHNLRRVIRALEVIEHSGRPFSVQRGSGGQERATVLGLELPRELLYERIDRRVEAMYAAGLLDEVRQLERDGFGSTLPSMAGIGYPEAWAVSRGEVSAAEAIRRTQLATHRLARQQLTWFRRAALGIHWLRADRADLREAALAHIRRRRSAVEPTEETDALHEDARDG